MLTRVERVNDPLSAGTCNAPCAQQTKPGIRPRHYRVRTTRSSAMYISSRNTTGIESVRLQTHFARMTETANTSNRDDLTLTSASDGRVRSGSKPESRLRMKTQQMRGGGGSVKATERQFQQGKNPPFVRKERSSARTPCTAAPPPSVESSPRSTRPRCARGASSTQERSTPEDPSTQPGGSWMNRRAFTV